MNSTKIGGRAGTCTSSRSAFLVVCAAVTMMALAGTAAVAHSPTVDASLKDWCIGASSNVGTFSCTGGTNDGLGCNPADPAAVCGAAIPCDPGPRTEDSGIELTCGNCTTLTSQACEVDDDCPGADTCDLTTAPKTETAFWDNRTDGAVNDLASVVITQDATNLYIAAELWIDPDPKSLPFGQVAFDYKAGGLDTWHDPAGVLVTPGTCSGSPDRACTSDADCYFCATSKEFAPSTRKRTCGSSAVFNCALPPGLGQICNGFGDPACGVNGPCEFNAGASTCSDVAGDDCLIVETCENLGTQLQPKLGKNATGIGLADHLVLFDFSYWLSELPAALLVEPGTSGDAASPWGLTGLTSPWDPVLDCGGAGLNCWFLTSVFPGEDGGSGGPPGSVEVAIPWSAFGDSGFGPGVPFRFSMMVSRGQFALNYVPSGAIEDVLTEPVAQTTSTTNDSCPGYGIGNTACEVADGSTDSFVLASTTLPFETSSGGSVNQLNVTKGATPSVTMGWQPSCSSADTAYGVYEGTIAALITGGYDHTLVPGQCTNATTSATFNTGADNHYYLISPNGTAAEGSYGQDSSNAERPVGVAQCVTPQSIACP